MLIRLLTLIFSLSAILFSPISLAAAPDQIHILVDISGNMQQFDTDLQRIAALKEMINQLPEGSRAGIWTYAKQVNNLVPAGTVNNAWRNRAKESISKIRGYGPYNNLTKATEDSTYLWRTTKANSARKLVIFTAGGAKPSLSSAENQASKDKLLNLLPSLSNSKIAIYTIAFTSGADLQLLQKLSEGTPNGYFQAAGSDDLAPAFMKLTEELKSNTVPSLTTTTLVSEPVKITANETKPIAETKPTTPEPTSPSQSVADIAAAAMVPEESNKEITISTSGEIRDAISIAETEMGQLLTEFAAMPTSEKAYIPALAKPITQENFPEPLVITLNDGSVLVTPGKAKEAPPAPIIENTESAEVADVASEFLPTESDRMPMGAASPFPDTVLAENPEQHLASSGWLESRSQGDIWALILTILVFINLTVIVMLVIGRFVWLRYTQKKDKTELINMEEPSTEMES